MSYKESIDNADIADLQIIISTVWTLYVDLYLFSLIKTVLNVKHILNFMENIKCLFYVNVYKLLRESCLKAI